MNAISVPDHTFRPFPGAHPGTPHFWEDLAVTIFTHAAAWTVTQVLRAYHRASHPCASQVAYPAHPAIEYWTFRDDLTDLKDRLENPEPDPTHHGLQFLKNPLCVEVSSFEDVRAV